MAVEKTYVAKEATSQDILANVKPDLTKVKVFVGDFVHDDVTVIYGRLVGSERKIYGA